MGGRLPRIALSHARTDSLEKLKEIVPTLDVEFLEGQDFKGKI